eukprot:gene6545-8992_t
MAWMASLEDKITLLKIHDADKEESFGSNFDHNRETVEKLSKCFATTIETKVFSSELLKKKKHQTANELEDIVIDKELTAVETPEETNISIHAFWLQNSVGDISSVKNTKNNTVFDESNQFLANFDYLKFVMGMERSVCSMSLLCCAMDERPFNLDRFMFILSQLKESLRNQTIDTSISISSCCRLEKEKENYYGGKTGQVDGVFGKVVSGLRCVSPPLYYAVQTSNIEAIRGLLNIGVDVNDRQKRFRLLNTSHSIQNIQSYCKQFVENSKTSPHAVKSNANDAISVASQSAIDELSNKKEFEYIPSWTTSENEWEIDSSESNTVMTPFQLSFYYQNKDAFETFLEFGSINKMSADLHLMTKLAPWPSLNGQWPASFAQLSLLTSLKIEDPLNFGPIPLAVLRLVSLRKLDLTGSGYTVIPDEICDLVDLEELNISNMNLTRLPLISMAKLRKLTSVDCSGIKLASPPPEIVKRGPTSVAQYIRDLEDGAEENTDVLLMFIGDGEAGKTSTLLALKNKESNTARAIGVDDRTIGIDISDFKPYDDSPLRFSAWDFGGQAIYAIMQQLFMSRRAVYPLLWRIRESLDVKRIGSGIRCDVCKKALVAQSNLSHTQEHIYRVKGQGLCHAGCVSYESLIMSWTERLQFRVPGVTVVLIATHIDCATPEEVNEQCEVVAEVVNKILERQSALENGIPQLKIYENGKSLRVNNVNGEGVSILRQQLKTIAESLDFYGEIIPSSYAKLRRKLREMQRREDVANWKTWMTWDDYAALAAECGVIELEAINVATRFFHDTGELRYFGEATTEENKAAKERGYTEKRPSHELLAKTVFPNPFWIVDILRGLIRHEQAAALQLVESQQVTNIINIKSANILRRRIHRLMQRGLLHKDLLPYIWHNIAGMFNDADSNDDEFRRLIALMQAFDILMDKPGSTLGVEWIVPCLCAGRNARTIDSSAFEDDSMPFMCRLVFDALPPFFDMMLVAHVMNFGVADSVDFIGGAASFRKYGERALIFAGLGKVHNPNSVFRQDQLNEEILRKVLREDQCHVVISSSTRRFLKHLIKEVSMLEEFFPGLRRLATLFPCYSCRLRKIRLAKEAEETKENMDNIDTAKLLLDAEKKDIERAKVLVDVLGADDPRCDACYYKHTSILSLAWRNEPRLSNMVGWGQWYIGGGTMNHPYNNGRHWGTPRYYEEVLWMMLSVVDIIQPSEELKIIQNNDEFSKEIEHMNELIDERHLKIATHQEAGELPTMQSIVKYCARNMNALQLGYRICQELEQIISYPTPLFELNGLICRMITKREQLVPELLFLFRTITDLISKIFESLPTDDIILPIYNDYSQKANQKLDMKSYEEFLIQNNMLFYPKLNEIRERVWNVFNVDTITYSPLNLSRSTLEDILLVELIESTSYDILHNCKISEQQTQITDKLNINNLYQSLINQVEYDITIRKFIDNPETTVSLFEIITNIEENENYVNNIKKFICNKLYNSIVESTELYATFESLLQQSQSFQSEKNNLFEIIYTKSSNKKENEYENDISTLDDNNARQQIGEIFIEKLSILSTLRTEFENIDNLLYYEGYTGKAGTLYTQDYLFGNVTKQSSFYILNFLNLLDLQNPNKNNWLWPGIKSFLLHIIHIFENQKVDEQFLSTLPITPEKIDENIKILNEQFPDFILQTDKPYQDQFDELDSDIIATFEAAEQNSKLYDIEVVLFRKISLNIAYREVIYMAHYLKLYGESSIDVMIEIFSKRLQLLEEIRVYETSLTRRKCELCTVEMNEMIQKFVNIINTQNELSSKWDTYWKNLVTSSFDYLSIIEENVNERINIFTNIQKMEMMAQDNKIIVIKNDLSNLLLGSEEKARQFQIIEQSLVEFLKQQQPPNYLNKRLTELIDECKASFELYYNIIDGKKGLVKKRISAFCSIAENRTSEYKELMRLRGLYGPVWYFGGGERLYSNRQKQKWDFDEWKRFVDITNTGTVCQSCPAEDTEFISSQEGFKKLIVQPADPCSIFLSHTSKGLVIAQQIKESIAQLGIDVRIVLSQEFDKTQRLNAMKQAKVFICCIDSLFSTYSKTMEEYLLAESLKLEVVPILITDYEMGSISSWWPTNMPLFEHHSLFIDMRSVDGNNPTYTQGLCKVVLLPTLLKILNEWTPSLLLDTMNNANESINNNSNNESSEELEATIINSTDSYDNNNNSNEMPNLYVENIRIPCELCSLEGGKKGFFEQSVSRHIIEHWKVEELLRRENNPDEPPVAICPLSVECSGTQPHMKLAVEVVATKIQQDSLPCPRCLGKGIFPPFSFIRDKCLAELEINRSGSLACKRCNESVPLFELLRSEVFMSYNWGSGVCPDPKCCPTYWQSSTAPMNMSEICLKCENRYPQTQWRYSNQMLVNDMKKRIEEEAGVTCWHDVDRLVGGKDLVKEMEMGIHYAEVVVIFLSDNYKISKNCQKEYQFATNQGKYIIPVILSDYTIPFINKIEKINNKLLKFEDLPEIWYPSSMSSLSQFKPILLLDENQLENVLFDICERIQSRFHRAQRYATVDDAIGFIRDYRLWREYRQIFLTNELLNDLQTIEQVKLYCLNIFDLIDTDGNLVIDVDEMLEFLDKKGLVLTREQVIALVSEADLDCDEQLTKEEFQMAISTVVEEERNQTNMIL